MKKIILFVLLSALYSCKKKDNQSGSGSTGSGTTGATIDTYSVRIESNFMISTMSCENITEQVDIKKYNTVSAGVSDSIKNCPIFYSFTGHPNKKYRVYTYSKKNATDTTQYMTDTGLTRNYLQVKKNGTVIYEHTDTVGYGSGYGSHRITSNECTINY